jgi:polysaccharide export outer membrane protein
MASTPGQKATGHPGLKQRNPRYQLCKNDVLELNLPMTPEFNQTVTVQPDGYITLLGAGDLHVEGQTIPELIQSVRSAYRGTLHDPVITIHLKDFEKPYFIAGGEVGHPGKYDLRGDITVVEAVAVAGGFTESSKHSHVWVFRRVSNDWVETKELNVKKMLNAGNLSEDMHLHPGDMLYVPKSTIGKIRRYLPVASLGTYINPIP